MQKCKMQNILQSISAEQNSNKFMPSPSKRQAAVTGSPARSSKKRFIRTADRNSDVSSSDDSSDDGGPQDIVMPSSNPDTGCNTRPDTGTDLPDTGMNLPDTGSIVLPLASFDEQPDTGDVIMEELFPSQTVVSGPKLNDKVAACVEKKWLSNLTKDGIDAMGDIIMPQNTKAVCAPLLNPEIWGELPRAARSSDKRMINLQENLQRAALTSACTIEYLLAKEKANRKGEQEKDPQISVLMQEHMNSIALLGNVSQQLSFTRRQRLKTHMNPKISGICDLKYEGPHKLLFGDDFSQTLSRAEQKKKVTDTVAKGQQQQDFCWGKKYKKPPSAQNKSSANKSSSYNAYKNKDGNSSNYSRSSDRGQRSKKGSKRSSWKSRN